MNKLRIAVVEDNEILSDTLVTILHRRGFEATAYSEAEDLLAEVYDVRHIEQGQPDLVIIDLLLKTGKMQGIDLMKELVARDVSCEILVVSGYMSSADLLEAMMAGASDWVAKPFDYFMLMPKLKSMAETGRKRRLHRDVDSQAMDSTRLERPVFLSYSEKTEYWRVSSSGTLRLVKLVYGTHRGRLRSAIHGRIASATESIALLSS